MMAFQFANKPLPIPRICGLDSKTFSQQYRNRKPVILPDIVSSWIPATKWTPEYLTQVLQLTYEDKLQVLVSKDNKIFINHPDVAQLVTMTSAEFASHVFRSDKCFTEGTDDRTKYYLRTHSMPDELFRDIDSQDQVDSLLNVITSKKDIEKELQDIDVRDLKCLEDATQSSESTGTPVKYDKCKSSSIPTDMNMNNIGENKDEASSIWEDFLSPTSFSDEGSAGSGDPHEDKQVEKSVASSMEKTCENGTDVPLSGHDDRRTPHSRIFNSQTMQLWIGTRGNVTPLHYDRNHGLLAQIVGRKELVLFSHEDTPFLYPHPSYSERAHTSRINLRRLDESNYAEIFSKVHEAQPYGCILQPGELLYTPPFWWHDVTSLDDCVSVTLPWDVESYEEVPPCVLR